jgi:4-hydroxy-tetrahydrodipicolinate synthase
MRGEHVDEEALRSLVAAQIEAGIDALVPCGTTGESATLSAAEHRRVIELTVSETKKRVPVIAGAGSNSTAHAIELGRAAKEAGADAILVVTPYYNKPPQEGMYRHFRAVAEAVNLPMVLYNVPGRTACDLLPETVARLCEIPQVVAIKEASGTVQRTQQLLAKTGDRLTVLSGEDAINYPLYAVGARGCISVVSNVAPKLIADGWDALERGDFATARALHAKSLPLAEALFMEPSPIPSKTALSMMGQMSADIRLPMVPMTDAGKNKLRAILQESGLLK